jgi:glycosyltransferase involved in cell wall biosynthesis
MMSHGAIMNHLGVIAIGRNEGERLRRCLQSLVGRASTLVYVDSGSTDDSVAMAESLGVEVVALDMSRPFTAARARNAGFARLMEVNPSIRFVQFLDGDCEAADGWLALGVSTLEERPRTAVVFGLRREKYPERSIYNRIADVEWNVVIGQSHTKGGEVDACGGDAMIRVEAFREVDGYNPTIPAGEEPELCQRLRTKGWTVLRLVQPMTWHDSAMFHAREWARRHFRTGYGGMDFSTRFGKPGNDPFRGQIRSAWVWSVGWPLFTVLGTTLGAILGGWMAALAVALLLGLLPIVQTGRIAWKNRAGADGDLRAAVAYGASTMLGKPFQAAGHLLYLRDHRAGRHARLIEYKGQAARA